MKPSQNSGLNILTLQIAQSNVVTIIIWADKTFGDMLTVPRFEPETMTICTTESLNTDLAYFITYIYNILKTHYTLDFNIF